MENKFLATEVDGLFNTENPESLVNRTQGRVREAILSVPHDLLSLDEATLRKRVCPSATLNSLRIKFWHEYHEACALDVKIVNRRLWINICTDFHFYKNVLPSKPSMAWILCPLRSYEDKIQDVLERCLAKMGDILEAPITKINKDGKEVLDTAAANVVLKTYKLMDDRVHGAAIQRIHEVKEVKQLEQAGRPEQLDYRLQELENRLKEKENNGQGIAIPAPRSKDVEQRGEDKTGDATTSMDALQSE